MSNKCLITVESCAFVRLLRWVSFLIMKFKVKDIYFYIILKKKGVKIMLDFSKGKFHKYRLSEVKFSDIETEISPLLTIKEEVLAVFKAGRDYVLFTTKRLLTVDKENGRKTDFTSIPYTSIDLFAVETAGWMDRDAELDIFVKGMGKFCFEFDRSTSMAQICHYIAESKFN